MNLLILGGTRFLGRHFVEAALARGHAITLFNRGQTNADLYPQVERITGDRESEAGLAALSTRTWDAVVDTSGYAAPTARKSAEALCSRVDFYAFISTVSAYADSKTVNFDESYPLATMSDEDAAKIDKNADVTGETYGPQKALCEREVTRAFGDRVLLVRAGLIVGPHDSTDRFTYWVRRTAEGGEMLVPDTPDQAWQLIDARDLAEWTLTMVEHRQGGAFNVTSRQMAMGDILDACKRIGGSDATFVAVNEPFIAEHSIGEWESLPLWLPSNSVDYAGFWACNIDKALASGLTLRPISDTIRATLAWDTARGRPELKMGLRRDREHELIAAWKSQHPSKS
jgi:2'-hydroxyisoflavone reductase